MSLAVSLTINRMWIMGMPTHARHERNSWMLLRCVSVFRLSGWFSVVVVVYSLFIVAPIVCGRFVLGPCFVVVWWYMSLLVLQSSRWGKWVFVALLLLYFWYLVISCSLSFSHGAMRLGCSVWLCHLPVILTYFLNPCIFAYEKIICGDGGDLGASF